MKKNTSIIALALILTALGTQTASAQELRREVFGEQKNARAELEMQRREAMKAIASTSSTTRAEFRADIKEKRTEVKTELQAKRAQIKVEAQDRALVLLEKKVADTSKNLVNATTRLDAIAIKIGTRLAKVAAEGKDVSASTAALVAAKAKIADAKVGAEAIAAVEISTEDTKTSLENVKTAVKRAESLVRDAEKALKEIVNGLK